MTPAIVYEGIKCGSFIPKIDYTWKEDENHCKTADDSSGAMYTKTHSAKKRVGTSICSIGVVFSARPWVRVERLSSGDPRKSTGSRWYREDERPEPPITGDDLSEKNGMNYRWNITGLDVVPEHARQFLRFADSHTFLSRILCKVKLDIGSDGISVWP